MRQFGQIVLALAALALSCGSASAQVPTDVEKCISSAPDFPICFQVGGPIAITSCNRFFHYYYGKIAYYPLRCVGPITISLETYAGWDTRFPLYVEVVPLASVGDAPYVCVNRPGSVILVARGGQSQCGTWETQENVDITSVVPVGSLYAIRIHFFGAPGAYSPGVDCMRVVSHPTTAAVEQLTWGMVKEIFR